MQKCATIWLQIRIDDHRIQSDYKYKSELQNPEGKKSVLGMASAWWNRARHQWQRDHQGYCVCVVEPRTTPMTTWPPRPRTPSTQRTWTLTRECAALLFVSQVLVVMIHTLHHLAQVCLVRACHVHTWSERISSTLSPPFPSTSSSSHSSFISCTSSCTSSTTLRAVASLCTPPKRVWTLLTTPTSSKNQSRKSKENVQGNLLHDTSSRRQTKNQVMTPIQHNDLELCNVDYVSSNVNSYLGPTENWKTSILWESSYFFMVLWHGGSCQEMCGTILWVGEQNDSITLQSINSMPWWPSLQRRRIEICGRIVTSMLSNGSEMLVLGTNWKTWYPLVSEQTCTIDRIIDQSLWQTIISFDLQHSSYTWVQTILSCGKYSTTIQIGTVSRLRFCRRSWGFKNLHQVEHCAFSEAIRLFQSVGCVRNKLPFRTVQQNLKSFSWMQD